MRSGIAGILATALIASSIIVGHPEGGASDLLLDEGFEHGLSVWVATGGELTTTTSRAHEGEHAALLSSLTNGEIQHSMIAVLPGAWYTLSVFFYKNDPSVREVCLHLSWVDENMVSLGSTPREALTDTTPEWVRLALKARSPPGAAYVTIRICTESSIGGTVYIDDVQLEGPPPLPATATPFPSDTPSPEPSLTATSPPDATATPTGVPSSTPEDTIARRIYASLVNGDFEEADDGVLSGWQKYGGELWQTSRQRRSGRHAGELISETDSTKWAYQEIAVSGDTPYQFDTHVLLDDPAVKEVFLRISWYVSDDASGSAIATSDSPQRLSGNDPSFRHLSTGPALAPPAARSARFRVMLVPQSSNDAIIFIDDASVRQAPPEQAATPAPPPPEEDEVVPGSDEPGTIAVVVATPTGSPPRGQSPFAVKVNEVMIDPSQPGDDAAYEWLELYNAGEEQVDLAGWMLRDNSSGGPLPPLVLAPHSFAVITAGDSFRDAYPDFGGLVLSFLDGRIGSGLANGGDLLMLLDSSGALVDGVSWGDDDSVLSPAIATAPAGHSIERSPAGQDTDSATDFVDNASPSPGAAFGERAVAGAAVERQGAVSSVVHPPAEAPAPSSDTTLRVVATLIAAVAFLGLGLSAGLVGAHFSRQFAPGQK